MIVEVSTFSAKLHKSTLVALLAALLRLDRMRSCRCPKGSIGNGGSYGAKLHARFIVLGGKGSACQKADRMPSGGPWKTGWKMDCSHPKVGFKSQRCDILGKHFRTRNHVLFTSHGLNCLDHHPPSSTPFADTLFWSQLAVWATNSQSQPNTCSWTRILDG